MHSRAAHRHTRFPGNKAMQLLYGLCALWCLLPLAAHAQTKDTASRVPVDIKADVIQHMKTDSGEINKFIGNAVFHQGTDTLYCDSLLHNTTTNTIEAFSNVRIAQQGGTQGNCDYLRYTPADKHAFMKGNVSLTDAKNTLVCEELTYDLGTKVGVYNHGGTLTADSTVVTSREGTYNVKNKEARFTGNVEVNGPRYRITSKDLGYNTETEVETFYGPSTVTSDSGKSVLTTSGGSYDSRNVIAKFTGHSSIWNDGQYIEADTMHYNKLTGFGFAEGNVITIDTAQHSTLYCGYAEFYRKQRVLWATIKPVLVQVNGKDTLYMRADTFYSAPMEIVKLPGKKFAIPKDTIKMDSADMAAVGMKAKAVDSAAVAAPKDTVARLPQLQPEVADVPADKKGRKGKNKKAKRTDAVATAASVPLPKGPTIPKEGEAWGIPSRKYRMTDFVRDTLRVAKAKAKGTPLTYSDTAGADTSAPMFFVGYHHVLIFSDSLQGKCDSVTYTRSDSMIRMIYAPVAWAHNSQISGDTILMQMDSSHIQSMYVPGNALLVSQAGPEKAELYDQVQGRTLTAWFTNNEITKMLVQPDAESIYYSKDEAGAYLGVNQSKSARMRIFFNGQKIRKIKFEQDVHQTLTPMEQADLPNTLLSRFKWLMKDRPKTKEELFD